MKSRRYVGFLFLLVTLCVAAAVGFTARYSDNVKPELESEFHILADDEPWLVKSGYPAPYVKSGETLLGAEGDVVLSKTVFPEEMGENILLFRNQRQCVSVRVEGETLFSLGTGARHFQFGTLGFCAVPLPEKGRAYEIEFLFTNLEDDCCQIPQINYGTLNDILMYLCLMDLPMIIFIPILAVIGITLIILSMVLMRGKTADRRVFNLALFLILTTGWNVTDMYLITMFPINMELNSAVSHYLLMIMPVPVLFFIQWCCHKRHLMLFRCMLTLLMGNIVVQSVLYVSGMASLHDMVLISQGFLLMLMLFGVLMMHIDYRNAPSKIGRVQVMAFAISGVMGMMVVLAYWLRPGGMQLYRTMFQVTIMIFLISMVGVVIYSMEDQSRQSRLKDAELNAYRVISTIDQLTGLQNRRAFEKIMAEIDEEGEEDALLVFMDLNGLKYANDQFGHMAGDELIIAAARCIQAGFGGEGETYRVGGDEFACVVRGKGVHAENFYHKMDAAVSAYNENAEVPLSIARGSCNLRSPEGKRLTISDWKMLADKRMYEDKVINHRLKPRDSAEDYMELISSFVSAVDAKDSYTADHSQRVGMMTDRICVMLGLSESSRNEIHMAACLHDIGKIGVPDSILCKTGELTEEEWRVMQSHTLIGEEIIKHNHAFYEVSQIIRHHHERVDGKGYPDGIAGSEIPLGARIIALADSIDAMTSSRSYRRALSLPVCRREILANLGQMYDAAIGEIVLDHWSEIEEVIVSHRKKDVCFD